MGLSKRYAGPMAEAAGTSGAGRGLHQQQQQQHQQQHTKDDGAQGMGEPGSTRDWRAPTAWGGQFYDRRHRLGSWKQLGLFM
jgi:hypothetical protein